MAERDRRGVSRRMLELTCARSNFAVTTPSGLFASAERIGLDPNRLKDDALRTTLRLYRLNDPSPKLSA